MLDVRTRLAATSEHQHRLREHLAPVMHRQPFTARHDRRRQTITEPEPVGKRTKDMQPDMSDNLCAAPLHHHGNDAVTVHFASALPVLVSDVSTTTESQVRRALTRMATTSQTRLVNDQG